jgi:hypothetical protein
LELVEERAALRSRLFLVATLENSSWRGPQQEARYGCERGASDLNEKMSWRAPK